MKRFIIFFAAFLLVGIFFQYKTPVAHAQYYSPYSNQDTDPDVPQNLHTYTQSTLINILSTVVCILSGYDPASPSHKCLGYDNQTGKIGYVNQDGGALGFMLNTVAMTYVLPIHSSNYIDYLSYNFHIFSAKSYAAPPPNQNEIGTGAIGLNPLLTIWVAFRNAAYLLLVIVFVAVGFLIMLRIKIDPRTVMSIQNQIPKIIVGLLVITFSFAIAGLLIDLMYVTTYLLLNIANSSVPGGIVNINNVVTYTTPFDAADKILPGHIWGAVAAGAGGISDSVSNIVGNVPLIGGINDAFQFIFSIFQWIGGIIGGNGFAWNNNGGNGGLVQLVLFIIMIVAVLTALFKFWISLVTCYINILFNVVLGPIRILFGIIPSGPGGGMTGWIKDLIANLAVFPVSIGFLVMAAALAKAVSSGPVFAPFFVPGKDIGGVLSFVAILMLPKLPEQVKEWFKVKDGALGGAVGGAVAAGVGFLAGSAKRGGQSVGRHIFRAPDPYRFIQAGLGYKLFNPNAQATKGWQKPFAFASRTVGRAMIRYQGLNPESWANVEKVAKGGPGAGTVHGTKNP